jgi:hypothetical protein
MRLRNHTLWREWDQISFTHLNCLLTSVEQSEEVSRAIYVAVYDLFFNPLAIDL